MSASRRALAAGGALAAAGTAAWLASRARAARSETPARPFLPAGRAQTVRSADGTSIHVEQFGDPEAPPLVLVHAWMCSLELWHRQITALAPEARIVAYDMRGHGRSGFSDDYDYSIDAFGDDLEAVLGATIDPSRPAVLCGHSMGAMSIAAWAHRHPDSVAKHIRALAMVGTGMGDLITEALVVRGPAQLEGVRERVAQALMCTEIPFDDAPEIVMRRAIRYVAMGRDARDEDVALVARMVRACPRIVRGRSGGTLSELDVFDGLGNLDVPAVVIAGGDDRMTPTTGSRRLAELLPAKPEVVEVPGAGHMVPLEADETVTVAVRELLAAKTPTRPLEGAATSV